MKTIKELTELTDEELKEESNLHFSYVQVCDALRVTKKFEKRN